MWAASRYNCSCPLRSATRVHRDRQLPATLPSGGDCTLTLSFTPTLSGARSGTITANGNSSAVSAQLQLSGTGQDAGFLLVTPTSLNFGDQATGTTSTAQSVTLSNIGNAPLNLGTLSTGRFTNADATAFPVVNNCPFALDPRSPAKFPCNLRLRNSACRVRISTPTIKGTFLPSRHRIAPEPAAQAACRCLLRCLTSAP